jgi:hypothetical protein
MPRRPIELGDHGEVNVLAWVQQGGRPAIRLRGSRARAAFWTAETRVQVGEGYAGLVRVRARGSSRAEARAAMDRRVGQVQARLDRHRDGEAVKLSPRMPFAVYAEQVWMPGQRTKVTSGDRAVGR